jgi:DNA-binding transcriptional LysR family regulator
MNLRQVEVFRAVMIYGTTARAAEVLRISQPAVSKAVAEMERAVGFPLFHRIKGRLQPTAEGQLLFREVEHTFTGLAHLRGAAARIRDYGSGELRIACLSAFSTNVMPRAIKAFLTRNPKVAITFQTRMSSVVRDLVASGQFDLGLAADEVDKTGLEVQHFTDDRVALAVPDGHRLLGQEVVRPADLADEAFIALAPEDTARVRADRALTDAGVSVRPIIETPFTVTICAMVAAGLGIGFVDPRTAEPYLGRGLSLRRFEPALYFRTLLLFPPNRPPSALVREFIADLKQAT